MSQDDPQFTLQLTPVPNDAELHAETRDLEYKGKKADLNLKRVLGPIAVLLMIVQVVFADFVFLRYCEQRNWDIPASAMIGWLGAVVIEVIGVVLVITRYLYPSESSA